jgi:hypothetical protein
MPEGAHALPKHRPLHAAPKRRRITPIRTVIAAVPVLLAAVVLAATAQAEPPRPVATTLTANAGHTSGTVNTDGVKNAGHAADAKPTDGGANAADTADAGDTAHAKNAADLARGTNAAGAAKPDLNCALTVPADPLTAKGLATPYSLSATARDNGPCHEANADQSAFVEATILDPATGAVTVYHPLVIDQGTRPAAQPVVPALPPTAVVGIWFGFNGTTLTLRGAGNSLENGRCVNGLPNSPFGEFAYCNAPAFFTAAQDAIHAHRLVVPDVGIARDGLPCPTTRDFSIVDQDQSDNVPTTYVAIKGGRTAQFSAANSAQLPRTQSLTNGSDNSLLNNFVDRALGCTPFTAPDLTNNRAPTPSLALNELQAGAHQAAPVALVPPNDPMTKVNGRPSVTKTNLYRAGVGQPAINPQTETAQSYCQNLRTVGSNRLTTDRALFRNAASPNSAEGVGLFDFLSQRLKVSNQQLACGRPAK